MEEAGRVLIDLHAVAQEIAPIGLRHHIDKLFIRNRRDHQPYIHPGICGNAQRLLNGFLHRIVRRCDVEHPLGRGDQLQIGGFRRVIRVIQRAVLKGLAEALRRRRFPTGPVVIVLIRKAAPQHFPHLHKLCGKAPCPVALQPDPAVLPMAEALHAVGVLVADVDAAGISRIPVNDRDLPMVPIVEVKAADIPMDRIENLHLDTGIPYGLQRLVGKAGQRAEVVYNQVDLHPGCGPFPQSGEDLIPDRALRQNVILHKNIGFRLLQMLHEILKERLALLKIGGVGISVKPEFPLLKIGRQPSPRRAAAGQRRMIHAAEHLHALPLRDRRNRLQALLLGLMRPAPEAEEDHAGYRQNQQQAHPAQLIGGAAGTLIDPDCHHNADELQECIYEAGFLFQKMHQQQCHRDLRQHRQGAHQQTGRGGDPPLCPFMISMGHSAHAVASRF